jgi:hypothetical protein
LNFAPRQIVAAKFHHELFRQFVAIQNLPIGIALGDAVMRRQDEIFGNERARTRDVADDPHDRVVRILDVEIHGRQNRERSFLRF